MDLNEFEWTREPGSSEINGNTISITTAPHTDLWQRTYYHFRNDNAPVFQMKTREQYFSFSRRADDYCIECSTDGANFSQMRICHMYAADDEISFGINACSPEESSFTAVFSDMKITECMWKAHDGQQPDE